jgi:tetratricopeptide (TPR) repeat protein
LPVTVRLRTLNSVPVALALLITISGAAAGKQAVAIVTKSGQALIIRSGDSAGLTAADGELLFDGDNLVIPVGVTGEAEFKACSNSATKSFRLNAGHAEFRGGAITGAAEIPGPTSVCALPDIEQDPAIGMMTERSLPEGKVPVAVTASDLAKMNPADRAAYQTIEAALRSAPKDLPSRLSRAVLLQRNGIDKAAASELLSIAADWPDEQWARTLGYTIATRTTPPSPGNGKLYAAFIGISQYEQPDIPQLKYADADAQLFSSFLLKSRAQVFSQDRLFLKLINKDARSSMVRTKLKTFFDQAQASDSIMLYIAAHGVGATKGDKNGTDSGYVILYDTHLESTWDNSLSMEWIRELFLSEAAKVRHVYLFVDTCHANRIGEIRGFGSADGAVAKAAQVVTDGKVLAMYASGPNQISFENPKYGGGHGAFTYFLLRALNMTSADPDYQKADIDASGSIDKDELVSYVEESVRNDTHLKQIPKDYVNIDSFAISTTLPGLSIAPCCGSAKTANGVSVNRDPTLAASDARSLDAGEWQAPQAVDERADWEEKSQQVLYKYLQGEEIPQTAADYTAGLEATERARNLAGESLYLDARAEFFRGRLLLFGKSYDDAAAHLEKAIRMDPGSPYAYNALGIAWLERGRYNEAEAAFNDAIRRAVNWAYPRHNLALVYLQRGDYARAIATYREAEQRTPQYSYLPYNLGLIYQRLNEANDAARQYQLALKNQPERAAPLVALGALMAERGRDGKARNYYRQAAEVLARNPEREVLLNLRHNQGTLEARRRNGLEAARLLWQANIDEADYLPSRFAMARAFAAAGGARAGGAAAMTVALAQYEQIVARVPENSGARIEYADVLYKDHRTAAAVQVLEKGLAAKQGDTSLTDALARIRAGRPPQ